MGLDPIELVLAVEERFGIEIPDSEAANLVTGIAAGLDRVVPNARLVGSRSFGADAGG
jgi:hypothetical protein